MFVEFVESSFQKSERKAKFNRTLFYSWTGIRVCFIENSFFVERLKKIVEFSKNNCEKIL